MMGSGERGASICFTTLRANARRLWTLNEVAWPVVPTGTIRFTLSGKFFAFVPADRFQAAARAASAPGSLPKRNSASSLHMRCRVTASLRATATRARAMPRRFAMLMPQARRLDHLRLRTSSERSEEHTSDPVTNAHLVCRLLLDKKKKQQTE